MSPSTAIFSLTFLSSGRPHSLERTASTSPLCSSAASLRTLALADANAAGSMKSGHSSGYSSARAVAVSGELACCSAAITDDAALASSADAMPAAAVLLLLLLLLVLLLMVVVLLQLMVLLLVAAV